jgi:hypothetical protein
VEASGQVIGRLYQSKDDGTDRFLLMKHVRECPRDAPDSLDSPVVQGEAAAPVTVVSLPARGRPPQAAARRAGLEFVEKLLTSKASKGSPMRDAHGASISMLSRVGILGKQGKVILEGPGKTLQERASLVSRCERRAADHAGLGVAPHARHQQVWP